MTLYKINYRDHDSVYVYAEQPMEALLVLKQYNEEAYDYFTSMEILEEFTDKILVQTD